MRVKVNDVVSVRARRGRSGLVDRNIRVVADHFGAGGAVEAPLVSVSVTTVGVVAERFDFGIVHCHTSLYNTLLQKLYYKDSTMPQATTDSDGV